MAISFPKIVDSVQSLFDENASSLKLLAMTYSMGNCDKGYWMLND